VPDYLLDTNVLVHAIRRKKNRWELLDQLVRSGGNLGCSVITLGEIYAGMRSHEKERTEELLAQFDQYDVTGEIACAAGALKNEWATKGFVFTLPDMLIAATALRYKLTLVTETRRDFVMPDLVLYPLP
jgi:predicted nucleic acid-binding protein